MCSPPSLANSKLLLYRQMQLDVGCATYYLQQRIVPAPTSATQNTYFGTTQTNVLKVIVEEEATYANF